MLRRSGVIAAAVVAVALTGCSATTGSEPNALSPVPTVTVTVEAEAAAPTPSVAPMPAGISEDEAAFLSSARFIDERPDADLLASGHAACNALRSGDAVGPDDEAVKFAAVLALCPDVQ